MTSTTRLLLVVLRLAIGWHLLFAGIEKVRKDYWSSEGYLREATGPLGPAFRDMAGDAVVDQLTLRTIPEGTDLTREPLHNFFPPALEGDWKAYHDRLIAFYHLNDSGNEMVREAVAKKFQQQKDLTARWLQTGTGRVKLAGPGGTSSTVELTTPERIRLYKDKLAEVRTIREKEMTPAAGTIYRDVAQKRLETAQAEANLLRRGLSDDVNKQTEQMQSALKEAVAMSTAPDEVQQIEKALKGIETDSLLLNHGDLKVKPQESRWKQYQRWREWTALDWSNTLVVVGLCVSGALLLLGLFTRLGCVLGALLLLTFYLPTMPLFGIPESLRNEGYPFINKNLIEMLALLALATTQSGKWLGLDGLVQFLNPRRWRRQPPVDRRGPHADEGETVGAGSMVSAQPSFRRDTSHGH